MVMLKLFLFLLCSILHSPQISVMAEGMRGKLVGGLERQNLEILGDLKLVGNGRTLWDYLQDKIEEYARSRNSLYMYGINDIHVQSQVVQGILYKVTVDLAPTNCRSNKFLVRILMMS